jgi:hypothetical protein
MMRLILIPVVFAAMTVAQERLRFQDDLWREFDVYRGRLLDLAKSIRKIDTGSGLRKMYVRSKKR